MKKLRFDGYVKSRIQIHSSLFYSILCVATLYLFFFTKDSRKNRSIFVIFLQAVFMANKVATLCRKAVTLSIFVDRTTA